METQVRSSFVSHVLVPKSRGIPVENLYQRLQPSWVEYIWIFVTFSSYFLRRKLQYVDSNRPSYRPSKDGFLAK